jgi:hypothetical protein
MIGGDSLNERHKYQWLTLGFMPADYATRYTELFGNTKAAPSMTGGSSYVAQHI